MEEEFFIGYLLLSLFDSISGEEVLDVQIFNELYLNNVGIECWFFFNLKVVNYFFIF